MCKLSNGLATTECIVLIIIVLCGEMIPTRRQIVLRRIIFEGECMGIEIWSDEFDGPAATIKSIERNKINRSIAFDRC